MGQENVKIGFLGAGNMAGALVKGIIESRLYNRDQLTAFDKDREKLRRFSEQFGVACAESNGDLVRDASTVVLCVKPQNMKEVLEEVKDDIRDDHLVISIAAGIPLKLIRAALGRDTALIRVMPNTPALIQKGASALALQDGVTDAHKAVAEGIFGAVGDTVQVDERMMDAVTALSGSGPGYVFKIMECMVDAGTAVGLEKETALRLVVQTFLGAAHLAKTSEMSLAELREMVTSPGGTTAAGLKVLDGMGLGEMIRRTIEDACKRSEELGKAD